MLNGGALPLAGSSSASLSISSVIDFFSAACATIAAMLKGLPLPLILEFAAFVVVSNASGSRVESGVLVVFVLASSTTDASSVSDKEPSSMISD